MKRLQNPTLWCNFQWLNMALCAVVTACAGMSLLHAAEKEVRSFSFSPDPAVELLKVRYAGGMTGASPSYTLFADGRLLIQRIDHSGAKIFDSIEYELSYEEVIALLHEAVDAGLMEYDKERVQRKMGITKGATYAVQDGSTMFLSIHLESYRGPHQVDPEPASVTIEFDNPTVVAPRYPEVKEIQGLANIAWKLYGYKKLARGAEK